MAVIANGRQRESGGIPYTYKRRNVPEQSSKAAVRKMATDHGSRTTDHGGRTTDGGPRRAEDGLSFDVAFTDTVGVAAAPRMRFEDTDYVRSFD